MVTEKMSFLKYILCKIWLRITSCCILTFNAVCLYNNFFCYWWWPF